MDLLDKFTLARWKYAIGCDDNIEDPEYRLLEDRVKEQYPDCELLKHTWSDDPCPIDLLKRERLMDLYREFSYTYQSESISSIYSLTLYKNRFLNLCKRTRVSGKIDGWSFQVNYYNGFYLSGNTRGRSGNIMFTDVARSLVPATVPWLGKVKITGELAIVSSKWEYYKTETGCKKQRNAVSTAISRGDSDVLVFIGFHIMVEGHPEIDAKDYDLIQSLGIRVPMHMYVNNFTELDTALQILGKKRKYYITETDGAVVENEDTMVALRIYAWEEKELMSYVTGYEEKPGIYSISVNTLIRWVTVSGTTHKRVTTTNLGRITDNNLKIGAPIVFTIRSDATAVINETRTQELQEEWEGNWEGFKKMIDEKEENR